MPPTPEQIEAARAILAAAEQPAIETPSAASSPIKEGLVVLNTTAHGNDRYGFVIDLQAPAIVGTDDKGADITAVHADVVWFNGDGLTSVPVDELRAIG